MSYKDTTSADYLDDIRKHQAENRNANTSAQKPIPTYIKPMLNYINISTTVTNTEKSIGDYKIVDNRSKLVSFLPFDYDTLDASNSNHGTVTGTDTYVTGPDISSTHSLKRAFSFNGSSYILLANESNFDFEYTNTFSISLWTKNTQTTGNRVYVAKSTAITVAPGWYFFQNTGNPFFNLVNTTTTNEIRVRSSLSTSNGLWHHVTVTYSGSGLASGVKFYVDGVLDSSPDVQINNLSASILNSSQVAIGAESDGDSLYTGSISDVQIWNVELSQSDVNNLYAGKQINKDAAVTKPAIVSFSDVT